jgi:hypothetical protein
MKTYAVIGGIDYEGEDFSSLRLFDCLSAAEKYMEELQSVHGYDYFKFKTLDVEMQSELV